MSLKYCPYCGKRLYLNEKNDLFCVNDGIVELSNQENKDETNRSYVG